MNGTSAKLSKIRFVLDKKAEELSEQTRQELSRACARLSACDIDADWQCGKEAVGAFPDTAAYPDAKDGMLILTDSAHILRSAVDAGRAAAGYLHDGMKNVEGASFLIAEADEVEPADYEKIYDRLTGRPWTILETTRTVIRETTAEDADRLYACYDAKALRFLAPLPAREEQLRNMASYREKVYGFYGFGEWSVLEKESGLFIGLMGFEPFVQGEEAVRFGYLFHPDFRGKGYALECGKALIEYGERQLGFDVIRAETSPDNTASRALLKKLGFAFYGTEEKDGKIVEVFEHRAATSLQRPQRLPGAGDN